MIVSIMRAVKSHFLAQSQNFDAAGISMKKDHEVTAQCGYQHAVIHHFRVIIICLATLSLFVELSETQSVFLRAKRSARLF